MFMSLGVILHATGQQDSRGLPQRACVRSNVTPQDYVMQQVDYSSAFHVGLEHDMQSK